MPDRIIRESICTSETLNELSDFEERFWHRLIVNCDDFGRFYANPAILRGKLFPLVDGKTKKDMTDALNKLASVGLVELYTVDGKPFLHVVKWSKYQRTRATKSKFPSPDDGCKQPSDTCCQLTSNVPVFENRESNAKFDIRETGDENGARTRATIAAVMTAYLDKVNPQLSERGRDELVGFVQVMGAEVCLRAIDEALDAKKANWPYVKAILQSKQAQGVRCLADWDKAEAQRQKPQAAKKPDPNDWKEWSV